MKRETVQRRIVLATIDALGHSSINEIISVIRERFPEIGVATIYRNIDSLVELEQVRKLSTNLKEDIFEVTSRGLHDHFICTECGKIIDIPLRDEFESFFDEEGNLFLGVNKTYYGVCKDCIKNNKS